MAVCEVCGNDYDKSFKVVRDGEERTFDCFECAIQSMAPTCSRCGLRILGHGAESGGKMFCGAHCANEAGVTEIQDRV